MTWNPYGRRCAVLASFGLLLITQTRALAAQDAPPRRAYTLEQAIAAARMASPEVRAAREAVVAAEGRARQAGAWPNPVVSYGREQTSASGATSAQNIALLEQRFEPGGLRSARIAAARARHRAAEARLAAADGQLLLETTRAYALAAAADHRARLANQAAEAFQQALGISERRLAAGDVSGYAHRRIRLEAARYATLRVEALIGSQAAHRALAALVSATPESIASLQLTLADSLPAIITVGARAQGSGVASSTPDSLVAAALRSRPDLRALELEAAAARADGQLAARERVPAPAISLGFKNENVPGPAGQASGFVAGISLPLPLWDRRAGAIAAADAESKRRVAEVDALRRRVVREVAEAYDAYTNLAAQLDALAPQLGPETRTAMRSVQVAYTEGEVSLVEWLDAVRAYQEMESSYVTLRAEALVRRAALERAIGASSFPTTSSAGADAPDKD
jgi:cobalt-zinc-cadmium efflux system outer membrane protein